MAKRRKAKVQPSKADIDRLGDKLGKQLTVDQIDKLVAALRSLRDAAKSLFF